MNLRNKRRLGDILIGAGKINSFQLNEALKSQKLLGKKLGEVLIDLNILTEEEIQHNYKVSCQYNGEDIDGKAEETTASGENGFTVYS